MRGILRLLPSSSRELDEIPAEVEESWKIRIELATWAWRVITEIRDDGTLDCLVLRS